MIIDTEKLHNKMIQAGYTTKTFAKAAGISVSALQRILSDQTFRPRPSTITKLTLTLNCGLSEIAKFDKGE